MQRPSAEAAEPHALEVDVNFMWCSRGPGGGWVSFVDASDPASQTLPRVLVSMV